MPEKKYYCKKTIETNNKKKYRILSCDGGGIRGIASARFLEILEQRIGKPLNQVFNLFAGTSTGAIIATKLALGEPASSIVRLYEENKEEIFSKSANWQVVQGPRYFGEGLAGIALKELKSKELKDFCKSNVLIPTYNIDCRRPHIFCSIDAKNISSSNFYMRDVIRAACAAPTYFPPVKIWDVNKLNSYSLIDGGVCSNNPSMLAYSIARKYIDSQVAIEVYSLGTGVAETYLCFDNVKKFNSLNWILSNPNIMDICFDGQSHIVHECMKSILGSDEKSNYFRWNMHLETQEVDNISEKYIQQLKSRAANLIIDQSQKFKMMFDKLSKEPRDSFDKLENVAIYTDINLSTASCKKINNKACILTLKDGEIQKPIILPPGMTIDFFWSQAPRLYASVLFEYNDSSHIWKPTRAYGAAKAVHLIFLGSHTLMPDEGIVEEVPTSIRNPIFYYGYVSNKSSNNQVTQAIFQKSSRSLSDFVDRTRNKEISHQQKKKS